MHRTVLSHPQWQCRFAAALLSAWLVPTLPAADLAADREQGRKLFDGLCATCHGPAGMGGSAPSLMRPKLERAPDDDAFRAILANGIPERGMPRVRIFTDNEQQQLIAYVRAVGAEPRPPVQGNAANGAEIYQRLGCATCHMIRGQGGSLGPDLTVIGQLRGAGYLRQSVVEPGAALPAGNFAGITTAGGALSRFLPLRVLTRDGREIRGYRVNEDTFALQLRELDGKLHSFRKSELKQIEKQPGTSVMPDIGKQLPPAELDDLIAYLSGLGTAP